MLPKVMSAMSRIEELLDAPQKMLHTLNGGGQCLHEISPMEPIELPLPSLQAFGSWQTERKGGSSLDPSSPDRSSRMHPPSTLHRLK
jgi:hypothetical protein